MRPTGTRGIASAHAAATARQSTRSSGLSIVTLRSSRCSSFGGNAMAILNTSDLWTLAAKAASEAAKSRRRTAVLCPAERFDHARFFAMCAERHSLNIRAFVDYEHAIEWLIGTDAYATPA